MDDVEGVLAKAWLRALAVDDAGPESAVAAHRLLRGLIIELLAALHTDPFDPSAGAQVGRALVAAQWTGEDVPSISAGVLYQLADHCLHPESASRLAALFAGLGQGHQAGLCDLRGFDQHHGGTPRDPEVAAHDSRFRMAFDNIAAAVAIGDTEGRMLEANNALAEMIGVPVDSLHGISVYDFAHPDDQEHIRNLLYDKLVPARSGTVTMERRLVRADGSIGWMSFAITYVPGSNGDPDYLLAVGGDVTELHERHEELHREARHDPLTGLPNRRLLAERVGELTATARPEDRAAFCFADLDHFKVINDRYGHNVGDKALIAVAKRLRTVMREHECLVARIGGDEFVVLISPPASTSRTSIIADHLLSALSAPVTIDGHELRMSASIGVIVTPVAGADAESLLAAADTSLYYAKTNGKGHWVLQNLDAPA